MIKSALIITCGLHLALPCIAQSVPSTSVFKNIQLYEGSRCQLDINGGGEGVCTKAVNCPRRLEQIEMRNYSDVGRCGFSKFDEIVCCAIRPIEKSRAQIRSADAACERYRKNALELEDDSLYAVDLNRGEANAGEFPQMATLGYAASDDEEGAINGTKYVCGGTLISEKHVITAAHCVNNRQELVPVVVLLGAIDLANPNPESMQRIPISRILTHPEYNRSWVYHDLAILELETSIRFSNDVQPTCLQTRPSAISDDRPSSLVVLGWGAIDYEGTAPTRLRKAAGLKIVPKIECSKSFRRGLRYPNRLDDGMTCVFDGSCWGDSGGPLLTSSVKFSPLIGVSSFGIACGGNTPGVYMTIYHYLDWIEAQVWPNSN